VALLVVEDLVVRFRTREGTIHAVNGVTFELEEGERLGLVGESGCGKSVTNLAVIRLLPKPAGRIEGGRVIFDGQDLATLPESEIRGIRGRDIAMIFQDPMTSLNPVLTIREQMVETNQAHRKMSKDEAKARAVDLLAMVGIPNPADRLYEGRFPFFVLANRVNWLTNRMPPSTSCTERFITPLSSLNTRSRTIFPLSHSMSSAVSASSTASSATRPLWMAPLTTPSMLTLASATRWMTARISENSSGGSLASQRHPRRSGTRQSAATVHP
jgi:hypothetical protein